MEKEFASCAKKSGGCSDDEVVSITKKYIDVSNQNITAINNCILQGNVACVTTLESAAASASDVDRIIPTGYGSFATVFQGRQNNINMYGSTKGNYSLFGTDKQQAQDVAQFRQTHCSGLSGATCDGLVQEALDDRMKRAGILTAAAIAVPVGVNRFKGLRLPGKPIATKIKPNTSGGGKNTATGSKVIVQEMPKIVIEPKIAQQMAARGWTEVEIKSTIASPARTVSTTDARFDPVSGTRLNSPATGYIATDGSYVIRNNKTGQIVQISNKNNQNWKAPW